MNAEHATKPYCLSVPSLNLTLENHFFGSELYQIQGQGRDTLKKHIVSDGTRFFYKKMFKMIHQKAMKVWRVVFD